MPEQPSVHLRRRVALYSPDTQGLGHVRRNLSIAGVLADSGAASDILLVSGARGVGRFSLPPRTDLVAVPALYKYTDGRYGPQALSGTFHDLVHLRGQTITAALAAYDPDVLVVDKAALGVGGELRSALNMLRERGRCSIVLGLRDVLDEPAVVRAEWARDRTLPAVRRYYDAVWVYGDPRVYDPVVEYRMPRDVAKKVRYTGYLGRPAAPEVGVARPARFILCCVGGGQDGYPLAEAFLQAELPPGREGVVVTGPYMAERRRASLSKLAEDRPGQHVVGFIEGCEALVRDADAVVSMGGYNAICELLPTRTPKLVVPRVRPRREQWIRAERLAALGLLDVMHLDEIGRGALTPWLATIDRPRLRGGHIELDGLGRLPGLFDELTEPGETVRRVAI